MPLNNPAIATQVTSGSYTGDGTVNRTIPHGLPGAPKVVFIQGGSSSGLYRVRATYVYYQDSLVGVGGRTAVTPPDSINFHVGNASEYNLSANASGQGYSWMAVR